MTNIARKTGNNTSEIKENKTKRNRHKKPKRNSENFVIHLEVNKMKTYKTIFAIVVFLSSVICFSKIVLPNDFPIYAISISMTALSVGIIFKK